MKVSRGLGLPSLALALAFTAPLASAQAPPYGLETRAPIGPYLNNVFPPKNGTFGFPPLLSATGAFSDLGSLTPSTGIIPFAINSPLWSDSAIKSRWMAVPNDGPPYATDEQISFAAVGEWGFPNGTVFIKHFELTVNEGTGERKRLETRFLVRDSEGGVYGISYKWRPDHSDADLLPDGLEEKITITDAAGATRIQNYSYPSRADCLFCHNQQARYVLGPKTHQLNGEFTYPETGRTDNQLRTLNHLGLLNPAPSEASFATYLKSVPVSSTTAPVQHRMRSWIDANCSHCHRPGGFGPGYDGRFYTPLENQNLIDSYVQFRDLDGSLLYQRDNALDQFKMPPLAKNLIHQTAMATLRQWIASPLEMLSVYLHQDTSHLAVRFNSFVDPQTATVASNYSLAGLTISEAVMGPEPDTVILTVTSLTPNQSYILTATGIQDTASSANTIWPGSRAQFVAQFEPAPSGPHLANIATRLSAGQDENVLIAGFIVRGGPLKRVLVRALGPSLSSSGIAGELANPVLELRNATGVVLATNDNWADNANQQEIIDSGLAPASPNEAVILMRLPSNENGVAYTAILRGANNTTGVGLVEVYDLDRAPGSTILNISTRGRVQTGDNVLIAGTIVAGPGSQKVLLRAIGPSLNLPGKLPDPILELRDAHGALIRSNDNWRTGGQEPEIAATTIPPSNDLESAIVFDAPASGAAYTAIVRGVNATTGIAVVEVYALP